MSEPRSFEEWWAPKRFWKGHIHTARDAYAAGAAAERERWELYSETGLSEDVAKGEEAMAERDALRAEVEQLRDDMEGVGPPPSATQLREVVRENLALKARLAAADALAEAVRTYKEGVGDYDWEGVEAALAAYRRLSQPEEVER